MHQAFEAATPSLSGGTELVVMAPIKPGFVPALDTVTYASRVKLLLRMLHAGRQSQHEYRALRALSDAVERVGVIHTLRVNVVESPGTAGHIMLSVNFDGSYEAYVRTIWQKASRLLDLIFCNSDGYPTGWDHSLAEWDAWIRSVQVPTPFFYAPPGFTAQDGKYLLMFERRDRGMPGDELSRSRIAIPTAEEIAWDIVTEKYDPTKRPDGAGSATLRPVREAIEQSLSALAGIYRLAEWYRPGTDDGQVLWRAARELLPELGDIFHPSMPPELGATVAAAAGAQLIEALGWFLQLPQGEPPPVRVPPPLPAQQRPVGDVQGGILNSYDGVTHGCLCLLSFADAASAAGFLQAVSVTAETGSSEVPDDQPLVNLAFTFEGLRACGLGEDRLAQWPVEFRQGMQERAGLLGDERSNHPREWTLPRRNWPQKLDPGFNDATCPAISLEQVHALLQVRLKARAQNVTNAEATVAQALRARCALPGVIPLSVQWMRRHLEPAGPDNRIIDHFGFTDGDSQPRFDRDPAATRYPNQVALGEVLLGYDNAADRAQDLPLDAALQRNGSFLVVRKLKQDVQAYRDAVQRTVQQDTASGTAHPITAIEVRAHMMGRWPANAPGALAGLPLVPVGTGGPNDFRYEGDPSGEQCPLGAHIRRANPREVDSGEPPSVIAGGRPPRLVRRGLPYGPKVTEDTLEADRGLMFMAYNASIGQQFEVIQRWLSGGNSARGYSRTACPFVGVPERGLKRDFRFMHDGRTLHMHVDGSDALDEDPRPLVVLQWGLYAFAPSPGALQELARIANTATAAAAMPWSAQRGADDIAALQALAASNPAAATGAWKAALEDPESLADFRAASIWAAVRERFGGVLRIPYGVLVASPALVQAVLSNETLYSVRGYQARLTPTGMGPIFLGLDSGNPNYAALSAACNAAIEAIGSQQAFADARQAAQAFLGERIQHVIDLEDPAEEPVWKLTIDVKDIVVGALARLCEQWFGLDEATQGANGSALFRRGGVPWSWQPGDPVTYPGHFTAASRATFQPCPTQAVLNIAAVHGRAVIAAMDAFLQANQTTLQAPITRAVLASLWPQRRGDAVRTVAGAMMGFLPTTEGLLRRVIAEWTRNGTLLALASGVGTAHQLNNWGSALALLEAPLRQAMKFRPMPEQVWRTAVQDHALGDDPAHQVQVRAGDILVVGQVSATHEGLSQGDNRDVFAVFGGARVNGARPTHACPGYEAAMGAMLGMVSALLDFCGATLIQGPAPGVLCYTGTRRPLPMAKAPAILLKGMPLPVEAFKLRTAGAGHGTPLWAFGDSWMRFEFSPPDGSDLQRALAQLGYETSGFNHSKHGYTLQRMWGFPEAAEDTIYGHLRAAVRGELPMPRAVLLDGGGNDFKNGTESVFDPCGRTGLASALDRVLQAFGANPAFNQQVLNQFLTSMSGLLAGIIGRLARAASDAGGKQLATIVVHAYDHPVPDGKRIFQALCPLLAPSFIRHGFPPPVNRVANPLAVTLMATFIDQLNNAYDQVVQQARKSGIDVVFARLTGVLENSPAYQQGGHTAVWANELHPNIAGFGLLAQHLHDKVLAPLVNV